MWLKPRFALANPNTTIPVPKHAYDNFLDYEAFPSFWNVFGNFWRRQQGELVIITSKDALNVSVEDAPGYILGYTCGNDLTAREWHDVKRSSIQLGYSKGFDNFAPIGPSLVSRDAWIAAPKRHLKTYVNGKLVQDAALETMTFNPEEVVSFLSQGSCCRLDLVQCYKGLFSNTVIPYRSHIGRRLCNYDGNTIGCRLLQQATICSERQGWG